MSPDTPFRIVLLLLNLILLATEIGLYRQLRGLTDRPLYRRAVATLFLAGGGLAHIPWLLMVLAGRGAIRGPFDGSLELPYFLSIAWSYSFLFFAPLYALVALAVLIWPVVKRIFATSPGPPPFPRDSGKMSRATFLKASLGSLPVLATGSAFSGMAMGSRQIVTQEITIPIADLHEDLAGLRILQISDLHVGLYIHDRYLGYCANLIESHRADVLVVTGDILDNNNYYLPVAGRFFRRLADRFALGTFGVLGNHDHIDNPTVLFRTLRQSGLDLGRNALQTIQRGKGQLDVMSLDWPRWNFGAPQNRRQLTADYFQEVNAARDKDHPLLLLNHHPEAFHFFQRQDVDLVLSGHTHGGQIAFLSQRDHAPGLVTPFYTYYKGYYQENTSQLYVNSGLGHWFPLRIHCPAEITLITLIPSRTGETAGIVGRAL